MGKINTDEIKSMVSMVKLLSKLGYEPVPKGNKEKMYLSMLRDSDTTPSFSVNDELGVWFDHGSGIGGNVIDFGLQYWKGLTFKEVISKIVEVYNLPLSDVSLINRQKLRPRRAAVKIPNYLIQDIQPLGSNQFIQNYLESRGVWGIDNDSLREVYYLVVDEKKCKKWFFAVGWLNEKNAWEVRNKYFKGSLGRKALTHMKRDPLCVLVFEGYMNYLSWKRYHMDDNPSIIVLNSLTTLDRAIELAVDYSLVYLYLDNDPSGISAVQSFIKAVPSAKNNSDEYQGYNDYNDKLTDELKNERFALTKRTSPSDVVEHLSKNQIRI